MWSEFLARTCLYLLSGPLKQASYTQWTPPSKSPGAHMAFRLRISITNWLRCYWIPGPTFWATRIRQLLSLLSSARNLDSAALIQFEAWAAEPNLVKPVSFLLFSKRNYGMIPATDPNNGSMLPNRRLFSARPNWGVRLKNWWVATWPTISKAVTYPRIILLTISCIYI